MTPPFCCDASGKARSAYPCPRCGRDVPIYDDFRLVDLKRLGWSLLVSAAYVNWCGHAQEFVPIPETGETAHIVPILGEAS